MDSVHFNIGDVVWVRDMREYGIVSRFSNQYNSILQVKLVKNFDIWVQRWPNELMHPDDVVHMNEDLD